MRSNLFCVVAVAFVLSGCGRVLSVDDGGVNACVSACGLGCAAPGYVCYSDGHDYCSSCVASCYGASVVACQADGGATDAGLSCAQRNGTCQQSCSGSFTPIVENGAAVTCGNGQFCCASAIADAGPTCGSLGGTCGAVSSCSAGVGYLTESTSDCTGSASVCCLPLSSCNNQPEFSCCAGQGQFRPSCIAGQLVCTAGTRCGGTDGGTDAGVQDCVNACPVGCAAPGSTCYSDGHDYCSQCVATCYGATQISCGG